jgi:hypothetical protein
VLIKRGDDKRIVSNIANKCLIYCSSRVTFAVFVILHLITLDRKEHNTHKVYVFVQLFSVVRNGVLLARSSHLQLPLIRLTRDCTYDSK